MYYTVIKHDGHLRTRGKRTKHEPQASVFNISFLLNSILLLLFQVSEIRVYVKHGTHPEPAGTCRNHPELPGTYPEPAGTTWNLPETTRNLPGITRNLPGTPLEPWQKTQNKKKIKLK